MDGCVRKGSLPVPAAAVESKPTPKNFEHALFKFDDNFDDLDFDIDSFEVESKKAPEKPALGKVVSRVAFTRKRRIWG